MLLLANLFILLSIICFLLNLAGFIVGCQGIQFVSRVPRCDSVNMGDNKICFCCEESHLTGCAGEETALMLYRVMLCSVAYHVLKKVLFALCALNAITTTVCYIAATLHYFENFSTRRSCTDESQLEDQDDVLDPDDFVPPVPPPSYFATFDSCGAPVSRRMLGSDVIPLPHSYGAQIKDLEVFCPLGVPPPYEAVQRRLSCRQERALRIRVMEVVVDLRKLSYGWSFQDYSGEEIPESSSRVSFLPSNSSVVPEENTRRIAFNFLWKQSEVLSCKAAIQAEIKSELGTVTLWENVRARPLRGRCRPLVDYKPYTNTKHLVEWILEELTCITGPEIYELLENIKFILRSAEEHIAEDITSATLLEQVMAPAQQAVPLSADVLPGLLHVENCGGLSSFTTDDELAEREMPRAEDERPCNLIGIVRETTL
ncbi:PREDICTED: protein FAM189A2 [Phaethon lepturus]|uniref:protein FAM189A2 n=1 Tax=Phaethon lepturus TaxID=97097 RepID=UPI0005304795|nr:PREDICTED: protein FAM189A2 [Phaethon lepturus]